MYAFQRKYLKRTHQNLWSGKDLAIQGGGVLATEVLFPTKKMGPVPTMTPQKGASARRRHSYSYDISAGRGVSSIYSHADALAAMRGSDLPHKKRSKGRVPKKMTGYNIINAAANRASKKVSGSRNIRGVRGKKRVKVSARLRKKIKQVIESKHVYGEYRTTRMGAIGVIRDSTLTNYTAISTTVGGYGSQTYAFKIPGGIQSDFRTWWAGLCNNGGAVEPGDDFSFFTPLKIMDAASVMWNFKGPSKDYSVQTQNFQMRTTAVSGAPVAAGTNLDPQLQLNKIHVVNAFVQFEFRNTGNRTMHLKFYMCVPKVNYPALPPLDTLLTALRSPEASTTETTYFKAGGPTTMNIENQLLFNPQVPPKMSPIFNESYKYEVVEYDIGPGETVCHSLQGPRNMDFDYNKFFNSTRDETGKNWKKSTVAVMIEVVPDLVWASGNAVQGRLLPIVGTAPALPEGQLGLPIVMEIRETFKLTMPDNVGFIQRVISAGQIQLNNLRYNVRCFGNFSDTYTQSGSLPAYQVRSKEDPIEGAASSEIG